MPYPINSVALAVALSRMLCTFARRSLPVDPTGISIVAKVVYLDTESDSV